MQYLGIDWGTRRAAWCAISEAGELREGVVVTMLCDSAAKYLSEEFWSEPRQGDAEVWP